MPIFEDRHVIFNLKDTIMKDLELAALGVEEMNESELVSIEGGSIFTKAWHGITNGLQAAHDWIEDKLGIEITLGR